MPADNDEAKPANLPLPLSTILQDLAIIRANDIDLGAILREANMNDPTSKVDSSALEDTVEKSRDFIAQTRSVLKSQSSGEVEKLISRIDRLCAVMESTLEKLSAEKGEDA